MDEDEPEALFGFGARELLDQFEPDRTVTIVGSRRSGSYGREVARDLGFGAASAGLLVVSGMALGCDSAAHEGALDANGATIAVLGGPADVPYPRSKEPLYRRILASGGAVISEQPSGTEIYPSPLPRPQPDHGRAGRVGRDRRGRASLGHPAHREAGRKARARGAGGPRPGELDRCRSFRTSSSPKAPRSSATRRICSITFSVPVRPRCAAWGRRSSLSCSKR